MIAATNIARRPMIAFGCSIIMPDVYERRARPGIERAVEADSVVLEHAASGSIARSYNLMLDRAAGLHQLEALVLLHQDAEIVSEQFCTRLRRALADPRVALVGCVGSTGPEGLAWWDGEVRWASAPYAYGELGGGTLTPRFARAGSGEVGSVYGVVMALSPWAVRNVRFDESIGILHGYDQDVCRQVRATGRRLVVAELGVLHHHSLDLVGQIEIWVAAHMRAAELWEPNATATQEEWKRRARRAEADAAAARLLAASKLLQADATAQYHAGELTALLQSRSWRLTEPLRRGNALLGAVRARLARD